MQDVYYAKAATYQIHRRHELLDALLAGMEASMVACLSESAREELLRSLCLASSQVWCRSRRQGMDLRLCCQNAPLTWPRTVWIATQFIVTSGSVPGACRSVTIYSVYDLATARRQPVCARACEGQNYLHGTLSAHYVVDPTPTAGLIYVLQS